MIKHFIKGVFDVSAKEIGKEIILAGVAAYVGYRVTVYFKDKENKK